MVLEYFLINLKMAELILCSIFFNQYTLYCFGLHLNGIYQVDGTMENIAIMGTTHKIYWYNKHYRK